MSECSPHLQQFYNSGQVMIDVGVEKESQIQGLILFKLYLL